MEDDAPPPFGSGTVSALAGTIDILETDPEAAATVHARKRWFSVDEYQDTNPMQQRLLELWLGDRADLCVVGDEDQTIYTFTGATSGFLTGFAERHPDARVIELAENYRSSPQVLALANNLLGLAPGPAVTGLLADALWLKAALQIAGCAALLSAAGFALVGSLREADRPAAN